MIRDLLLALLIILGMATMGHYAGVYFFGGAT